MRNEYGHGAPCPYSLSRNFGIVLKQLSWIDVNL